MSNNEQEPGSIAPDDQEHSGISEDLSLLQAAVVIDLGSIEETTLGSSASGYADANSQYYW